MPLPSSRSRRAARQSSWLAAALLLGSCGAEPEDTSSAALRLRFPAHADAVLSAREAFAPAAGGFRLAASEPGGAWVRAARPEVELPRDGSGVIRFRLASGGEIRVRELGAAGEGAMAEGAVSYRRAGGTSFWTATDGGVEEWLLLDAGVAQGGEVVAAWEVDGAQLRERGAAVELVDEARGAPVLRVTAPRAHAASGRAVVPTLRVRGARIELSVDMGDAGGEAVLVDPAWEPAGRRIVEPREQDAATLLEPSGKVLVAGGHDRTSVLNIAELYDPTDHTWSLVRPMLARRYDHTATSLLNDEVLVIGGRIGNGSQPEVVPVDTVELYDLVSDTWRARAFMATSRSGHTATRLLDGKVLVTGGLTGRSTLSSAELYDPATDTWAPAASMNAARFDHTAVLLQPSGKVLVVGGVVGDDPDSKTELYDPATDTWTPAGPPRVGDRLAPVALAQLHNGEILAVGAQGAGRYDPTTGAWSATSPVIAWRDEPSATTLYDGKVLVAGEPTGEQVGSSRSVELYDPEADTWTPTAPTNGMYSDHFAIRLLSGDVLLIGDSVYPERYSILGTACASEADCGAAACVDGVCCESRCSEPCHTCALPTSLGRCVLQPKGSDDRGECAREGCDGSCDGFGACSAVPKDGVCLPARCSDETHRVAQVLCPADGASCAVPSSEAREVEPCAPYHCDQDSGACKVTCSSMEDCVPGHACDFSGHCVRPPPEAIPGCSAGGAAAAAGASRAGLAAVVLALLAVARRRASAFRGQSARRRGHS
ncbi:Kelch repeat-containing protein [Sorangium sp. So ce1078]|uniref:Kelch repeat-containing protein n=1 Tax=Sorangium sp. So ce1078 TaxID=3133329 RepID=UPI003F5E44C1